MRIDMEMPTFFLGHSKKLQDIRNLKAEKLWQQQAMRSIN